MGPIGGLLNLGRTIYDIASGDNIFSVGLGAISRAIEPDPITSAGKSLDRIIHENPNTVKDVINEIEKTTDNINDGLKKNFNFDLNDLGGRLSEIANKIGEKTGAWFRDMTQYKKDENPTSNENEMSEQDNAGNADTPTTNSEPTPTNAELERQQMLEDQQRLWEREDTIRKETQEREDTAYQRAVADMEKAGINPNLAGVQPASAGGGISNASGLNYNTMAQAMQNYMQMLLNEINNDVKIEENQKDRITDLINGVGKVFLLKMLIK